ncbi:MAG: hypothetical protein Kow00105_07380 [Phycisphaeraceae bacterium]
MWTSLSRLRLVLVLVSWMMLSSHSEMVAQPPGDQLIDRVIAAYADLQQYDATLHLAMRYTQVRWTTSQEGDYFIAFDRPTGRIVIDTPEQLAVTKDGKFFYRTSQIPGRHLEIQAPTPLTYEWIIQQAPDIAFPALPPDVAFLIGEDPLAFLNQGGQAAPVLLPPDPKDPKQRPRIRGTNQMGTMTLSIDPVTYLIEQVVVEVDPAVIGAPAELGMTYTFDITPHSTNQPIGEERFAFDTNGSLPSPDMQHMMASGSNAPHPLTGQPAPALKLPDIDGNEHDITSDDADAKVIVLDFWATWCPPCVAALPELQNVYDWVQSEGKPVAIYAVNQGETVEEVKAFWQEKGLSIPVLMDQHMAGAQAYHVQGIPQTVIIANGKVIEVHVGYAPGIGDQIKAEIEKALEQ